MQRYTRPSNVVDRLMQAEENRRARLLQMQVEDAQRKEQVIKVPQMNAKSSEILKLREATCTHQPIHLRT